MSVWTTYGFTASPYDARPLPATAEGFDLFVGREELGTQFLTETDCDNGCIFVVSGDAGVGKTSFLNVHQYLLYSEKAPYGPKLVPAFDLTTLQSDDTESDLARRLVQNTVGSVESYCSLRKLKFPAQLTKLKKWLAFTDKTSGFDVGLSVLGVGGNVALTFDAPPISEANLETWRDVFRVIASEVRVSLKHDGLFVILDNAENVDSEQLSKYLMGFRDTLFAVEDVWWGIIGQSGLYSLLDSVDKRISQRIRGTGLEVRALSRDELHDLIERRVQRYRSMPEARSPIPREVHDKLYDASKGEVRFVLKTSEALCSSLMSDLREMARRAARTFKPGRGSRAAFEDTVAHVLGQQLIDGELPAEMVISKLKRMTVDQMTQLRLKPRELEVLRLIGDGEARASDYKTYRLSSMQDFSSNYLSKMFRAGLLHRRAHGRAVYYSLRGMAALAHEYELMEQILHNSTA